MKVIKLLVTTFISPWTSANSNALRQCIEAAYAAECIDANRLLTSHFRSRSLHLNLGNKTFILDNRVQGTGCLLTQQGPEFILKLHPLTRTQFSVHDYVCVTCPKRPTMLPREVRARIMRGKTEPFISNPDG